MQKEEEFKNILIKNLVIKKFGDDTEKKRHTPKFIKRKKSQK